MQSSTNYVSGKEKNERVFFVVASKPLKNMRIGAQPAPKANKWSEPAPHTRLAGRKPRVYRVTRAELTGRFFALNRELSCAEQGGLSGKQGHFDDQMESRVHPNPRGQQMSEARLERGRRLQFHLVS
jgi:hypothetical protein